MKGQFLFEKKESHLLLTVSGEYAKEEFLPLAKTILEKCEKEKTNKVLIDASKLVNTDVRTMERFTFAELIANILGPKIKLAVVWPKEHINKFAENVAVNRGGRVYVSGSLEAAGDWLLSDR